MNDVVVIDFETSGMSPQYGDRVIEIGAVRLRDQQICERFQALINPGFAVSSFIEEFTGISNSMLAQAPGATEVVAEFRQFLGQSGLVAHNASFDQRFLTAELARIGCDQAFSFACSMLVARRVYPQAPNHKLATLVNYKRLPCSGQFHRALADAEMTAHLWLQMRRDLCDQYGIPLPSFDVMCRLGRTPVRKVETFLKKQFDL